MTAAAGPERIRGFDGLRALAVLAVFLQHYTPLGRTWEVGSYGVWLFFGLSGFLIVRILHGERRAIEAKAITTGHALRRFFWRRTLRIMPIYYLALAVFAVLGAIGWARDFTFPAAWWHFAYLSNVHFAQVGEWQGRFGFLWSLAVEEQFYLLAAPALLLAPAAWTRNICAGVVLAALVRQLLLRLEGAPEIVSYTDSLANFGVIAFGGWLALALPARARAGTRSWPTAAGLALIVLFVWGYHNIGYYSPRVADLLTLAPVVAMTLLGAGTLAAVYLNQESWAVKALEWRPLAGLGRISYGLYLYHNLPPHWILTWASSRLGWDWRPGELVEAGFNFVLALALATASWRLIERPLLRLKDSPPDVGAWLDRLRPRRPAEARA